MINLDEFNLGEKIVVEVKEVNSHKGFHKLKGTLISKNNNFITIKTKNYNTSVNLCDFECGNAALARGR